MRIRWSPTALGDLRELRSYIARHDSDAAERIAGRILEAVERLTTLTGLGRPGRVPGTRELVVPGTPYVVPYTVTRDRVEIVAVLHGARRWPPEG